MSVFTDELTEIYGALINGDSPKLQPSKAQYKDFVQWQNARISEEQKQYWSTQLQGDVPLLNLPFDFELAENKTFAGGEVTAELGTEETQMLNALAVDRGSSLSDVLFTIFNILLNQLTGQTDVTVGVAIANRNHPDLERLMGFFVNALVIKTTIAEDLDFTGLLAQVSENMMDAHANQDYPFDLIVEELKPERISDQQPLFNVMYGFQNKGGINVDLRKQLAQFPNITVTDFEDNTITSKFDLTLFIYEFDDHLKLSLEYNTGRFTAETIETLLTHYQNFIRITLDSEKLSSTNG
jgi:non-ribosomal peptide synthetase component F